MARAHGSDLQEPDFHGEVARAWRITDPILDQPESATIGAWLVEATQAHPLWNYHVVTLVHLREGPGLPAPLFDRPGATHELVVAALNPDYEDTVDPALMSTLYLLTPPDAVEQLVAADDDHAIAIAEEAVRRCVDGTLIPDSDYRQIWRHVVRTLEQRPA